MSAARRGGRSCTVVTTIVSNWCDVSQLLASAVVALALLVAGLGVAHGGPSHCLREHRTEALGLYAGEEHGAQVSADARTGRAARQGSGESVGHGTFGSGCMATCSPAIAAADPDVGLPCRSSIRFALPFEPSPSSTLPDGPFRPPRA